MLMKLKDLKTSLLVALMTLTSLSMAAFEVGDLAFETCTVDGVTMAKCTGLSAAGKTKNTNNTIGYIQIPSTVSYGSNRYRVYYIGNSAFASTNITGVRINWGVYEIGNYAFKNCTQLTSARIASSVQSLQAEGFAGCTALSTVYWAGFGWGTGRMAGFWPSNSNMTLYINYEQTHSTSEFQSDWFWQVFKNVSYDNYNCSDVTFTDGYGLTIGDTDMQGASTYRNATVTYFNPSKTTITGDTYSAPTSDERMGVYYKWTKIGRYALASNSTVKTIDLTSATNLTTINPNAFTGSTELTKVTLPSSLSYYYFNAFYNCPKLTEFSVNSANTTFSSYDGCIYNKSQTLFYQAPQGKDGSVSFSSSVKTINDWAFYNCAKITKIFVPYGVTTIGKYAFYGTAALDYTFIPSSVTSLSTDNVFYGTKSNNYIYCNMQNPPTVNAANYFGTHSSMRLYVPYNRKTAYANAGWTGFATVNNSDIQAIDIYYNGTGYTVTSTASTTVNGTSYNGRVKVVCYGNPSMSDPTSIEIPASITHNGKTYAVTMIGEDAFNNHTNNFIVTGCANVDTIGYAAFEGQPITSYHFTHNLKRIDGLAFASAGLTGTVHIPYGVTYVGAGAFGNGKYSRIIIPTSVSGLGATFCKNTTTLTEIVLNKSGSTFYNYAGWELGTVPSTCYIRVPVGVVGQWKNNSALKSRASYITAGAYDFVAGSGYSGRYFMTITSSSQTTFDGTTYAGTAKYVYSPHIKTSSNTSDFQWEKGEMDQSVSTDKRTYLMTEIGDSTFCDVNNFGFSQYQMPASIKKIGNYAFQYATKMTNANLKLPNGLTTIGKYSFYGTKLSGEIKIPESVTSIGNYAFANISTLNALYFPKSSPSLGSGAWGTSNASNFTVWVPNQYANSYLTTANGWGTSYGEKISVWIKPYAQSQPFSSVIPVDLQGSNVTGYYASAFDKNNSTAQVTLTKANFAPASTGLILVDLTANQEYRIKRATGSVSAPMTNYLVATPTSAVDVYSQNVGYYWTGTNPTNPHFARPTTNYNTLAGSAYLKLSSAEANGLTEVYTNLWPKPIGGLLGDLDGNNMVDVEDVNAAINIILKLNTMADYPGNGDMDGNGMIDVEDVNAMINIILHLN